MTTEVLTAIKGDWFQWFDLFWSTNSHQLEAARPVLERDGYACSICGVAVKPQEDANSESPANQTSFMQVAPDDGDYSISVNGWRAICPFCHITRFLAFSIEHDWATLIYAPWVEQAEITAMASACLAIQQDDGHVYRREAKDIYQSLYNLTSELPVVFPFLDNIPDLSDSETSYQGRLKRVFRGWEALDLPADKVSWVMEGVRILPLETRFLPVSNHWASRLAEIHPIADWSSLIDV